MRLGKNPLGQNRLDLERQAAEKWKRVSDWWVETETWTRAYLALVDAQESDPKAFPQETRFEATEWGEKTQGETAFMVAMLGELHTRKDLARTRWGSALRKTPHPQVAYVGERLQPKKSSDKKDGEKKDSEKKAPGKKASGAGKKGAARQD